MIFDLKMHERYCRVIHEDIAFVATKLLLPCPQCFSKECLKHKKKLRFDRHKIAPLRLRKCKAEEKKEASHA